MTMSAQLLSVLPSRRPLDELTEAATSGSAGRDARGVRTHPRRRKVERELSRAQRTAEAEPVPVSGPCFTTSPTRPAQLLEPFHL